MYSLFNELFLARAISNIARSRKRGKLLILLALLLTATTAWGYCPEDSVDRGNCDTMYIEPWPADVADSVWSHPGPYFVRVPIYITDDIYASYDSILAFTIPLCYTHTNPMKYCSVSTYWNRTLWNTSGLWRSIFRHLPSNQDPQVHNWMMDLYDVGEGWEWDNIFLDIDNTSHFWLTVIKGMNDPRFLAGSRILLATMTMKLEDTMNICIDTCFWPPSTRLAFFVNNEYGSAQAKLPRSGTDTSSFQFCFPYQFHAPHVVSISPMQNQLNVPFNTNISVTFDINVLKTTINESTFLVNAWSTGLHRGTITYDILTKTATLNPTHDFDQGEIVTVVLNTGIESSTGIPMESSYIWSFTTKVNGGSACFIPPVNYETGDRPLGVFCADLDGDGDVDLAVVNGLRNTVSILKNNGDGTFQPKADYNTGANPVFVSCADLDRDSDLDLVTANTDSDNISVFKNKGDGIFDMAVNYDGGDGPYSIFCADLDGDGDLDLAVANVSSNNVSILKNNGNGTFQTAVNYGVGLEPRSIFCADLDGDKDMDIVVGNYSSNNVSILTNNGDGTFQDTVNYAAEISPRSVFCADLDGDGDLDLAVANVSGSVSIFKNNGNGTFQDKVNYSTGDYANSVFCSDLDGDGDLDLALSCPGSSGDIYVYKNIGDGTFETPVVFNGEETPSSVSSSDLDGDGDLDLAVTNSESDNVSILFNIYRGNCNGDSVVDIGDVVFLINYLFKSGPEIPCLSVGDANCDGMVNIGDVVYLNNYLFKLGPPLTCK